MMAGIGGGPQGIAGLARAVAVGRAPKQQRQQKPKAPPKAPGFHPLQVLKGLETGKLLTPEQLAAAARALTVLETKPEIHGYKQIATQLGSEKTREAEGLSNLAGRTQSTVASVYKGIAESEAQNLARQEALGSSLSAQSAGIAQQGASNLASMQQGAVGDLNSQVAMRGAQGTGGGAQQALAQAVASQQATQTADSGAAQQFAAQTGADYGNYGRSLAGSTQMQGGSEIGAIGRDVTNRIGESNAKYNTNIQTALGKLAEAKASYGGKFTKNLLGLRGEEQKFKLGEQAVAGNKASLAATEAANAASAATAARNAATSERNAGTSEKSAESTAKSAQASYMNAVTARWKAQHPSASSNEVAKQRQKTRQEVQEVKSLIPPIVTELGQVPKGTPPNKALQTYIGHINGKASANPSLVKKIVEQWFYGQHRQKERENAGVGSGHR